MPRSEGRALRPGRKAAPSDRFPRHSVSPRSTRPREPAKRASVYTSDPSREADRLTGLVATGSGGARYPLGALIGAGTQGLVFEVPGAALVVKVFRPSFVRSRPDLANLVATKEHVALTRLYSHASPYLVRLFDRGVLLVDGLVLPWLALARVPPHSLGLTLAERVQRAVEGTGFGFDVRRALRVLGRLAIGLGTLHAAGLVHRDVKPSNVLVSGEQDDETPLLADFGIVRALGLAPTFGPGYDFGSPGYAAPESRDPNRVSVASDVFSFAAIAFLVLSGEAAFLGNEMVILALIQKGSFRPLSARSRLHPSLRHSDALRNADAILKRALAVDPGTRPPSAQAFWADLGEELKKPLRVHLDASRGVEEPGDRQDDGDSGDRPTNAFDIFSPARGRSP